MTYQAYCDQHRSDVYDNAHKRVKGLWTLARREFGIKDSYECMFAAMNPESIAKLSHPHSHVIPRSEKLPVIVLRVSKDEMESEALLDTILPREMAHVVCKINPVHGNPYTQDEGWQKVYRRLGGKC